MTDDDRDAAAGLLDEAEACHDDEPERAAALLRRIAPGTLATERLPGLAFLLNHVLGEKLGAWAEAWSMFTPLLDAAGPRPLPVLHRQAAAAAGLAGDAAAAQRHTEALAGATGASAELARDVIALTQAMYRAPGRPAPEAAQIVAAALAPLREARWSAGATPLDAAAAACMNNVASGLIERPAVQLTQHAPLRNAAGEAAALAERLWLRAGNWVQHERAAYLRALVANALGEAAQARGHALRALAMLDANDSAGAENVDRAFLLLEQSRACRMLGSGDEAAAALASADALAAQFGDAGLDAWYASRRAVSAGA